MKTIFNRTPLVPNVCKRPCCGSHSPGGLAPNAAEGWKAPSAGHADAAFAGDLEAGGRKMAAVGCACAFGLEMEREDLKEDSSPGKCGNCWIRSGKTAGLDRKTNSDYWPRMLALRALWQYFTATADRQALKFMDAFFKYQFRNLAEHPLKERAVARGADNILLALRLFNLTGQIYLFELCRHLREQTLDWPNFFHTFSLPQPLSRTLRWPRLKEAFDEENDDPMDGEHRPYFHTQYHQTSGENIAVGLRIAGHHQSFQERIQGAGRLPLWLGKADEVSWRR